MILTSHTLQSTLLCPKVVTDDKESQTLQATVDAN